MLRYLEVFYTAFLLIGGGQTFSILHEPGECTFESGLCEYELKPHEGKHWKWGSWEEAGGSLSDPPPGGAASNILYMNGFNTTSESSTIAMSPHLNVDDDICLVFDYYNDVQNTLERDNLQLFVHYTNGDVKPLRELYSTEDEQWRTDSITLPYGEYRLNWKAVHHTGDSGLLALDAFTIYNGPCGHQDYLAQEPGECDFESLDFCDYKVSVHHDGTEDPYTKWRIMTSEDVHGGSGDYLAPSRHFAAVDIKDDGRVHGFTSSLVYSTITTSGPSCLTFRYNNDLNGLPGSSLHFGTFDLSSSHQIIHVGKLLNTTNLPPGKWLEKHFDLPKGMMDIAFELTLNTSRGSNSSGDWYYVAIDVVELHGLPCSAVKDLPHPCDIQDKNTACQNGGTCVGIGAVKYHGCICPEGYYGVHCQFAPACSSSPCLHGGTCTDDYRRIFNCTCTPDYMGVVCEKPRNQIFTSCDSPGLVDNATLSQVNRTDANVTAKYDCVPGFVSSTSRQHYVISECNDGVWEVLEQCELVDCGPPPTDKHPWMKSLGLKVKDANISEVQNTYLGYSVEFECSLPVHKLLDGEGILQCGPHGWQGFEELGVCRELKDCGQPPHIHHAYVINVTNTHEGGGAMYACDEGYEKGGHLLCKSNGNWLGEVKCQRIQNCGAPPDIRNAHLVHVTNTRASGRATYDCHINYRMTGQKEAICSSELDYKWVLLPHCDSNCPVPRGQGGNNMYIRVDITKCTTNAIHRYSLSGKEQCDKTVSFTVTKNDIQAGDNIAFYGSEVCISELTHYTATFSEGQHSGDIIVDKHEKCVTFCLPYHGGSKSVIIKEHAKYNAAGEFRTNKIIYKYRSIPADEALDSVVETMGHDIDIVWRPTQN